MNVNPYITRECENKSDWTLGENKPNSNPNKPNFRKAKMDVNLYAIEYYRKKDEFAVPKNKPNSNPISKRPKMSANAFSQKDYENETAFRLEQNKPNSNPISPTPKAVKQKSDAGCQRSGICLLPSVFCLLSMGTYPYF